MRWSSPPAMNSSGARASLRKSTKVSCGPGWRLASTLPQKTLPDAGFRNGYLGLTRTGAKDSMTLTPEGVRGINSQGGTVLGTSRGLQDPAEMVDTLAQRAIDVLFVVGGDGTLRGAQEIADEADRRG